MILGGGLVMASRRAPLFGWRIHDGISDFPYRQN
jgi:hypothetical protein